MSTTRTICGRPTIFVEPIRLFVIVGRAHAYENLTTFADKAYYKDHKRASDRERQHYHFTIGHSHIGSFRTLKPSCEYEAGFYRFKKLKTENPFHFDVFRLHNNIGRVLCEIQFKSPMPIPVGEFGFLVRDDAFL